MAASYSVTGITASSVTVEIVPDSAYQYYRVFVRLADDADDSTHDELYTITSPTSVTVSGLEPGTDYVVNVGYNDTGVMHIESWIGAENFTTEPATGSGVAHIYVSGAWVKAVPHIYKDGAWQPAGAHVYVDGWQATKEA